ncbi:hypothetical protein [Emticicia fontis]
MGAWGTGLFDNDTACDIKYMFHSLLAEDFNIEEIKLKIKEEFDNWGEWEKQLGEEYDDEIELSEEDSSEEHDFTNREDYLSSMVYLLWEIRADYDELLIDLRKVLAKFDKETEWKIETREERKKVLEDLIEKVSTPKPEEFKNEYDDFLESRKEVNPKLKTAKPWWKFW